MIIENDEEHAVMLELLDELMEKTPGSSAIGVVGKVIEEYELVHFPIPEPTPEEAAAFREEEEALCRNAEKGMTFEEFHQVLNNLSDDDQTTPERIAMHTAAKAFVRRWLSEESEGAQRTAIEELCQLECAAKWYESVGLTKVCKTAIEGATREALAKAAKAVVERAHDMGLPAERQELLASVIRALGAAE